MIVKSIVHKRNDNFVVAEQLNAQVAGSYIHF